jgi:maltooligosyltrehalose trehalohydrolase
MRKLSVWAPNAAQVAIEIANQRMALEREGDNGWWWIETELAKPGADYAFVLNEGQPLPDPRSPWQPNGVHGASRLIDHDSFSWNDRGWTAPPLSSAIIYELHLGTFTADGTFEAAIDRLSHLVELGVTHVELMPVAEFSGDRGWGYDGVDLFAPHHHYGGPDGLKRLVNECHRLGLAVILDVVYNHFGPSGNYLGQFGPYQTNYYRTPWGDAVNFDGPGSDEVRRFLRDNALMWLRDYHLDGLRLDAVHAMVDTSAVHFLEQLAQEVVSLEASVGRRLVLIAESNLNDPRVVRSVEAGGYGLDAQWNDDFHHALHCVLTGERAGYYVDFGSLAQLAKALRNAYVFDGGYSQFRRRRHGRSPVGLSGHRFIVYAQSHDQVGNRAKGERASMLMNPGRLKIAAALVMTAPFVPMLFQGEEWGASTPFMYFTGHQDFELGRAVSEGRKREFASFGWSPAEVPDPQAMETFASSKLDWSELRREPHIGLLQWHRDLIRLRKENSELTDGRLDQVEVQWDERKRWLRMARGTITVFVNLASQKQSIPMTKSGTYKVLLTSHSEARMTSDAIELPDQSVFIARLV